MVGVLVVSAVAALTSGCGGDDYRTLVRGQCLPASAEVVGTREADPPTVPCGDAHRYEVYAVTTVDGPRTFPGTDAVDELAQHACYLAFARNVGYPAERMPDDVKVVYVAPTASSWEGQADRDVECLLVFDGDRRGRLIPERPRPVTSTTAPASPSPSDPSGAPSTSTPTEPAP